MRRYDFLIPSKLKEIAEVQQKLKEPVKLVSSRSSTTSLNGVGNEMKVYRLKKHCFAFSVSEVTKGDFMRSFSHNSYFRLQNHAAQPVKGQ